MKLYLPIIILILNQFLNSQVINQKIFDALSIRELAFDFGEINHAFNRFNEPKIQDKKNTIYCISGGGNPYCIILYEVDLVHSEKSTSWIIRDLIKPKFEEFKYKVQIKKEDFSEIVSTAKTNFTNKCVYFNPRIIDGDKFFMFQINIDGNVKEVAVFNPREKKEATYYEELFYWKIVDAFNNGIETLISSTPTP